MTPRVALPGSVAGYFFSSARDADSMFRNP